LEIAKIFSDKIDFVPPRVPDIPHQLSDTTRMREILGWVPKSDVVAYFKDEVRRLVRENPLLAKPRWLKLEESPLAEAKQGAA